MTDIPVEMQKRRAEIAAEFLIGNGIEIGALDSPLQLPAKANVVYVDRLNEAALRAQYPELSEKPLVVIDVVDDGEQLGVFPSKSVDFIVANHFMEHTQNPIGTLRAHLQN